jgi:phytoene synthase
MDDDPPIDDLDALVRRVDPDRWMASRFVADRQARADVIALLAFDHELARAPRVASNPLIGEMRLTWWREVLDEIFDGRAVRRHPTAHALAETVRRRALPREPLEALIEARLGELDPSPMDEKQALAWARDTGGVMAELAARILDPAADAAPARAAGSAWALGRKAAEAPALRPVFARALKSARTAVTALSPAAFPAAAHASLAERPAQSAFGKRLRLTWAVARGRI